MSFSVETDQTYFKNLQNLLLSFYLFIYFSSFLWRASHGKVVSFSSQIQLTICLKRNKKTHQAAIF